MEHVEEHIIIITANGIVVEGAELRDHVDGDVADDSEVDVDTGPEDQRVHYCVEEASHELEGTQPERGVLKIEA